MSVRKTFIRFFTIADFEEEEIWLREQHNRGWSLLRMVPPCFYVFEECTPEDVVYRLDYKNGSETSGYFQLFKDYGWEYIGRCLGWLYFRKPASEAALQDDEIFSDSGSRLDMIGHVVKTRLLPLLVVFLCCVLPNFIRSRESGDPLSAVFTVFFSAMALIYLYLIIYCGQKLRRLRQKYRDG